MTCEANIAGGMSYRLWDEVLNHLEVCRFDLVVVNLPEGSPLLKLPVIKQGEQGFNVD
jgi:hypothetical protein